MFRLAILATPARVMSRLAILATPARVMSRLAILATRARVTPPARQPDLRKLRGDDRIREQVMSAMRKAVSEGEREVNLEVAPSQRNSR